MKKLVIISTIVFLLFISSQAYGATNGVKVVTNHFPYALCAASATTPTGKTIVIKGKKYAEGIAICPVITTGSSVGNFDMTYGTSSPDGTTNTIWSLFGTPSTFPQQNAKGIWSNKKGTVRQFVTSKKQGGGMSNMWSYPCVIQKHLEQGKYLVAACKGPINESPTFTRITPGTKVFTYAADGIANPVSSTSPNIGSTK